MTKKIKIYSPEGTMQRRLNKFLISYKHNPSSVPDRTSDLLKSLQEQVNDYYFPELFKHMVVSIFQKSVSKTETDFKDAINITFEFLKKNNYINRQSKIQNIRLTNKGNRREIYHAEGLCSGGRGQAKNKSSYFDQMLSKISQ